MKKIKTAFVKTLPLFGGFLAGSVIVALITDGGVTSVVANTVPLTIGAFVGYYIYGR